jgi:hypothetical protein
MSPRARQQLYGPGTQYTINTLLPFEVTASVDGGGALSVSLSQHGSVVTSFDSGMAGNPQGAGVPPAAKSATLASMGPPAPTAHTSCTHSHLRCHACAQSMATHLHLRCV